PADAYSTGSSMMPNKRNPDPAELIRGRSARVIGHLVTSLTMLKGLPGGYQRDLQEDKPPLLDAFRVLESSLRVLAGLVATLHVDEARMLAAATSGFTTATAVADALAELGVPFREAHHIVGSLVARAEAASLELTGLPDSDITAVLAASPDAIAAGMATDSAVAVKLRAAAELENALARPDVIGGTAPIRVHAELTAAAARLGIAD
ncbi:MAG: lyase family protein, partial [Chloroflexota bacterium]